MTKLLFVCLGNICRSPAADGLAQALSNTRNLNWQVDSAGTGAWHVGQPPDRRMVEAAKARGIDLSPLRARQVSVEDFTHFDHIFAMDRSNLRVLQRLRPSNSSATLDLFLTDGAEVPDPYYGDPDGFDEVLDLISERLNQLSKEL